MLPESINALVGPCPVEPLEDSRKYRGLFLAEELAIRVDQSLPLSWRAQTLVPEMAHLACNLTRGFAGSKDEREEQFCTIMGRLLAKVLLDNPGLLDPDAELAAVDVLGEVWRVELRDEPSDDEDDVSAWLHTRSQTMRCRKDSHPSVRKLRVFQLTCEAVLQAGGVEEFSDPYYWSAAAMLYALFLANPDAHPRAVMSNGPSE